MPLIRANRESVDDRFSVLGFSIRTESPLFEVAVATDPVLFTHDGRARRTRRNFYSSRAQGAIRARRGEAVYLVPPDVLTNFIGQPKVYFGLATYREASGGVPDFVQAPSAGSMYVSLSGLTERGLRRLGTPRNNNGSYGRTNGHDPSLDWGGDTQPPPPVATAPTPATAGPAPGNGGSGGASAKTPAPAPYDDGFGAFPSAPAAPQAKAAAPAAPAPSSAAAPATAPAAGKAQALWRGRALEADDEGPGITEGIPDDDTMTQGLSVRALDAPAPEYPGASRFAPAYSGNYRALSSPRTIDKVVIHITDGGSKITGTINWFQNPDQRNMKNEHITVSAHYVVGQDGEVVQMVRNNDLAWHASSANKTSIGIEHVAHKRRPGANGKAAVPALPPAEAQYQASAGLVAWLCSQFGIPVDRDHILGHAEASPRDNHDCPSALWQWDHYMELVQAAANPPAESAQPAQEPEPASSEGLVLRRALRSRAQEIIAPFYDPTDPASALSCQNDAFSQAREEWYMGVPKTTLFPHSAICQLRMTTSDGRGFMGTGFYIGSNRILTCAHNLDGKDSVTIIPGRNGSEKPFGECTVQSSSWRIARPPYTGPGNWENDLAVIDDVPLAAPNGEWFEFLYATPSDQLPIVVCGYSKGSVTVPNLTKIMDGDKQHLHGGYATGQSNLDVIEYPILTLKGNSGSPVYHLDDSSGQLKALVCAVHVTGEPAASGLNRGCFITPNKIDWIEGRATAFALDAPQARAPRVAKRSGRRSGKVTLRRPGSRAQGMADLLPVDLKIRVFIPAPVAIVTIPGTDREMPLQSGHGGDGRGFQLNGGTSRADVTATFHFGDGETRSTLTDLTRTFGQSSNYKLEDTVPVDGKPSWYRNIRPGAQPIERGTQSVTDSKLNLEVGGSSYHGILSMAENAVVVTFNLHASDPIVTGAPDIDATLALLIKVDGDRIKVRVNGGHDEFPAYEIYANGILVYSYDPVAAGGTPWGLFGDGNWDVNPDTSYVDVGPASDVRFIPVHIQGLEATSATTEYPVTLIPQPDKHTGWAAAMAMLLSFRRPPAVTPTTLTQDMGPSLTTSEGPELLDAVRQKYGFVPIDVSADANRYFSPAQWATWLKDFGPLWVVITGLPHAVVVSGLRGNPDSPESCDVKVLNPWDTRVTFDDDPSDFHPANPGYADWLPFKQFVSDFGNMAEPGYGNWFVLHLPARPSGAQSLAAGRSAQPRRPATSRAAAPRATSTRNPRAQGLEAGEPGDESIEPSRVTGTTMHRQRGSKGRVTWALDQLDGIKLPDAAAAIVPALSATTVAISDWPRIGHDPLPLPLTVRFDAGGGAVGNVKITAGVPADVPYEVTVTATIEDEPPRSIGKATVAAVKVTIDYDFSGTPDGDMAARVKLRLAGSGTYDLECAWQ